MNIITQNLSERLRPLVGLNGWDYCVHWKLSEDQRFLEWMGCCCGGTEGSQNGGEELLFPVSSAASCRDTMYPHPTTKCCALLSQLLTSIPLDSGIHAETLLSNQPNWVNYSNSLDSNTLEETLGTQVLIPVPGGLVELFVTKQVPEDHQVIDFITAQCNMDMSFGIDVNSNSHMLSNMNPLLGDENDGNTIASETSSLPPHECNSPLNLMQQFNYNPPQKRRKSDAFFEDSHGSFLLDKTQQFGEALEKKEQQGDEKDLIKHVVGRSDSMSDCSDQNEEEDDGKYRRRNGKGNQSKNLLAERRRRKKLNDSLYNLRSLVPIISKLDRASILGDAIEFVKDLQKQVKELQDELEEHSDMGVQVQQQQDDVVGVEVGPKAESINMTQNGFHVGTSGNGYILKQKQELDTPNEKQTQQMEPQVEVAVIDGNELFVKVFSEHRPGGFVKLMEAFNTLRMEVIHATVTSHKGLVSNVFKVEKRENEMVEAEDVRESLLELMRNPCRGWNHEMNTASTAIASENGVARSEYHQQHHLHNHHNMGAYHHPHHLHHIHT
ncbi:transcription factor ABORTED MICROSPORES [Senna tora]|uniref:Transcription factor ABORTED MICROSPORES n=1 Tax=Senna tora TaxID=362788 RepID=A0A834W727_9FABA|nr:transcription factor ABORTED MICROSPORES [Senna tora]